MSTPEHDGSELQAGARLDRTGRLHLTGHPGPVPWWSFTKTAIAICALRLVEEGALHLDEPVDGREYTLAQLLRHEAGLPDYGSLTAYHADVAAGRAPWPVERLLAEAGADRLRYEPGNGWDYSNIGYLEVRRLVERASGLDLGAALTRFVFAPAGLATARLALTPGDLDGVAMGDARGYHPGWVYHGLVTGTAADAARLLRGLVEGRLMSPRTFERMRAGRALPEHRSDTYPDPAYGLGLMLWATGPLDHPLGHTGGGPGSNIAVYARGSETCVLWAASSSGLNPVRKVFRRLMVQDEPE